MDKTLDVGPFLLNTQGFAFCKVQKLFVCNLVGLHALALDLGPKVQVPQKSEEVCLHGEGHQDLGKVVFTQHQSISTLGLLEL